MPSRDAALAGLRIAARGRGEMRAQTSEKAPKLTQQQTVADTPLGSFTPC